MRAWHDGPIVTLEQVSGPVMALDPLSLEFVRDEHLRSPNGTAEDAYVERLLRTSYRMAEGETWRALFTQQWKQILSGFPCGYIELPLPPCQSVDLIEYIDEDGVTQTLSGSPAEYQLVRPVGPKAGRARIYPAYDETWPSTRCVPNAVTVTFTAGYPETGSPAEADVPDDITHGRLLVIGELYKQRSESVHAFNQNPAVIRATNLWRRYRAY